MQPSALWKKGVPLREAPDRFAPARLAAPAQAPTRPIDGELSGGLKMLADQSQWDEERRLAVKTGLDEVQELLGKAQAIGTLNYERGKHVASLILKGKAIAVGFPKGTKEPISVPAYLFETDSFIRWNRNEVIGNDLYFASVRVAKLRRSHRPVDIRDISAAKKTLKVGRPASTEIADLIRELNTDPTFAKLPRKSQMHLILEKAPQKYPQRFENGMGISPATIYRYLQKVLGS